MNIREVEIIHSRGVMWSIGDDGFTNNELEPIIGRIPDPSESPIKIGVVEWGDVVCPDCKGFGFCTTKHSVYFDMVKLNDCPTCSGTCKTKGWK